MSTILITGGSGLIGRALSRTLRQNGHEVRHLSRAVLPRHSGDEYPTFRWDYRKKYLDLHALDSLDVLIHLAGENIGTQRWTPGQKERIRSSRVDSAHFLFDTIQQQQITLKTYITASATGWYSDQPEDTPHTESDPPGSGFLAEVCCEWESAADRFEAVSVRTVKVRTGVVLTAAGGMLPELMRLFRYHLGAVPGNGGAWINWIHLDDLCSLYTYLLESEQLSGIFNAVAPEPVTQRECMHLLAQYFRHKILLPYIPSLALYAALGQRARLILKGSRVSSNKVVSSGFSFNHSRFEEALNNLLVAR